MSIQRTSLPQDPFQRPATVAYGGQQIGQPAFNPQQQQWGQPQPQQPQQGGYNPGQYPPMPGAQIPQHEYPQQQQVPQSYQQFQGAPNQTQGPPPPAVPAGYQVEIQQQQNNRWSTASQYANPQQQQYGAGQPAQSPTQVQQSFQQPAHQHRQSIYMGGASSVPVQSPIENHGGFQQQQQQHMGQPPAPPPKDTQYIQQGQPVYGQPLQQSPPGAYQQPPVQQMNQFQQPQGQYQYPPQQGFQPQPAPASAPQPTASPHQSFHTPPPNQPQYGHHVQQSQSSIHYQHPGQQQVAQLPQGQVPNQGWQQTQPTPPVDQQQMQYHGQQQQYPQQGYPMHQQQPPPSHVPPVSQTPVQQNITYMQQPQDEPVSPILAARQNTSFDSKTELSRPSSHHIPSRSNSGMSRRTPNVVASPPRPDKRTQSPVSAMKTTSTPVFEKKRQVADPNGIGSTGASALGMGGPSDWETFGTGEDDVDDLEIYQHKQEPKKEDSPAGAPVELPAGSPVAKRSSGQWKAPAGVVEVEGSIPEPQAQPPVTQPHTVQSSESGSYQQAMPIINSAAIVSAAPVISSAPVAATPQPIISSQTPPTAGNSFIIDDGSGWAPPPSEPKQAPAPIEQLPIQSPPPHMVAGVIGGAAAGIVAGGFVPGGWQQSQPGIGAGPAVQNVPPQFQSQQPGMHPQAGHGGPSVGDMENLQAKLSQTETELSSFQERELQSTEEMQKLTDRIAKLQTECEGAQSEARKLDQQVCSMEEKILAAEGAKSSLQKEVTSANQAKAAAEAKVADLEAAMNIVKTESEGTIKNVKAEMEATRGDLMGKISAAEAALATAKRDAEAASTGYQAKLKEADDTLATTKTDIDVLKKQLEDEKAKPVDIAPGLGDWYKGSLLRFRDVLFAEEKAESIPDKMKQFQEFVNNETKLRGIEMEFVSTVNHRKSIPNISPIIVENPPARRTSPQRPVVTPPGPGDDAFVMVEPEEYSPGGRPIFRPAAPRTKSEGTVVPPVQSAPIIESVAPDVIPASATEKKPSPAFKPFRPFRADSTPNAHVHPTPENRSNSLPGSNRQPIIQEAAPAPPPIQVPPKPKAYQKPQYTPTVSTESAPLAKASEPIFSPPALTSSISNPVLPTSTRAPSTKPQLEIFLDDVVVPANVRTTDSPVVESALPGPLKPKTPAPGSSSSAASSPHVPPGLKPKTPAPILAAAPVVATTPTPGKRSSSVSPLEVLKDMLPPIRIPAPIIHHPLIQPIYNSLSNFSPADFAYIADTTASWETKAAATRRRLEAERSRRQAEAEDYTNDLFAGGDIGYGDIGAIEEEKKQEELEREEKENKEEWDSYLAEVFNKIFERLQKDINDLLGVRSGVDALCANAVAGARALSAAAHPDGGEHVALVDALGLLVRVHTLVAEYEMEADKTVIDRDRRFKKSVTRGLYRKGEIKKMKEQEAHFERLEKRTDADRKKERVRNCNILMKNIQSAVKRGCDENEAFAQELLSAVERLVNDKTASNSSDASAIITRARDVLKDLAASSTALMRIVEKADTLLNDAEYEEQLALERAEDADANAMAELAREKKLQDESVKADARKREAAVETALKKWLAQLDEQTKGMQVPSAVAGGAEEDEQEKKKRLQAALEEAKRRNGQA